MKKIVCFYSFFNFGLTICFKIAINQSCLMNNKKIKLSEINVEISDKYRL